MKPPQTILAPNLEENFFGDSHPLMEQIGASDALMLAGDVNASLRLDRVTTLAGLKSFLESYRADILVPLELPLICRSYAHASKNEFLELTALDQQLVSEPRLEFFASASKRIGRIQLKRLRPLRDQRGLQRYLRSVDSGEAHAWHTLVYGITLASFSLPLRQGLLNYSEKVLDGFVIPASERLALTEIQTQELLGKTRSGIPHAMELAMGTISFPSLSAR